MNSFRTPSVHNGNLHTLLFEALQNFGRCGRIGDNPPHLIDRSIPRQTGLIESSAVRQDDDLPDFRHDPLCHFDLQEVRDRQTVFGRNPPRAEKWFLNDEIVEEPLRLHAGDGPRRMPEITGRHQDVHILTAHQLNSRSHPGPNHRNIFQVVSAPKCVRESRRTDFGEPTRFASASPILCLA